MGAYHGIAVTRRIFTPYLSFFFSPCPRLELRWCSFVVGFLVDSLPDPLPAAAVAIYVYLSWML
jgi:hypothetical protein